MNKYDHLLILDEGYSDGDPDNSLCDADEEGYVFATSCTTSSPGKPLTQYANASGYNSPFITPSTTRKLFELCSVDTSGGKFANYVHLSGGAVYKQPSGVPRFDAPLLNGEEQQYEFIHPPKQQ